MSQAWIAGATGLIGENLSEILSGGNRYDRVNRLVRKPELENDIQVEYDHLVLKASPGDDYFCCLGTTIKKAGSQEAFRKVDEKYVVRFADEAKKNQARVLVVISAMGAEARSRVFYNRVKGQMETAVRRKQIRSVYILRPSLLLGDRKENRPAEKIASFLAPLVSKLLIGGLAKYKPVEASRVAELAERYAGEAKEGFHVIEDLASIPREI